MNLPKPVYTICLTVLILGSLFVLATEDLPRVVAVLALIVGASSAGILLGHSISLNVNGHHFGVEPAKEEEDKHADVDRPG